MDYGCCSSCHLVLHDPFVRCHGCEQDDKVFICVECFAKGREFGQHRNDHDYSIVKSDFSVVDPDWTAQDEMQLLSALVQTGEGNWDDICKSVPSKSASQCRAHFQRVYVENSTGYFDSAWKDKTDAKRNDRPVTYVPQSEVKANASVRPFPGSQMQKDLAGYNSARGDFDWESDNLAEMELNGVQAGEDLFHFVQHDGMRYVRDRDNSAHFPGQDEDCTLGPALSTSAFDIYNSRLRKRVRRKRIVKELGLLNKSKVMAMPGRYPLIVSSGCKYEQVFKLGRISCSFDFDFLLEGLEHELGLRQHILRLQEYRTNGIRHPVAAAFYTKLRLQRDKQQRDMSLMSETMRELAGNRSKRPAAVAQMQTGHVASMMTTRRAATPLDIVALPAYEKLSAQERELCSVCRVLPEVFLETKAVLMSECERNNGLRLADARPLVKIDVNKTRKLYDFLLKHELIYKPSALNVNGNANFNHTGC